METKQQLRTNRIFLVILLLATVPSRSQPASHTGTGGIIRGRILDSASSAPLGYVTLSLARLDDHKVVTGDITDSLGTFHLSPVNEGSYELTISFLGYKTLLKSPVSFLKTSTILIIADIHLSSAQAGLAEVTITGEHNLFENKDDKLIYHVDKDITSQGGVASDLLRKIPQITMDADGKVELQGNPNIRFLINGKPSSAFGNNIAEVLQNIPASQTQSIEVMTSPGAKYEAEGTAGVINIILKKSDAQGVNGSISASAGSRLENGSFNLSVKKKKIGVNAFFGGGALVNSGMQTSLYRTSYDPGTRQTSELNENGSGNFYRHGYHSGLSLDWEVTPRDNFSASMGYNFFGMGSSGTSTTQITGLDSNRNTLSESTNKLVSANSFEAKGLDLSLDYKRSLQKEGRQLGISADFSNGLYYSFFKQLQSPFISDLTIAGTSGENPGRDRQSTISLDFTEPVSKVLVIETGAKAGLNQMDIASNISLLNPQTGVYIVSPVQSSVMNYNRNIYASYLSAALKEKFIDIKAGLRYEYTETKAAFSGINSVSIPAYNTFAPTLCLSHTFEKNQRLKLSYNRRIERPDGGDLNPFINSSDPRNLSTGNPNLIPITVDKVELSYSTSFEKGGTINALVFYRVLNGDMQAFTVFYPTYHSGDSTYSNISLIKTQNIGQTSNLGVNLSGSMPVTTKLELRANITLVQRSIQSGMESTPNNQGYNYRANLNVTYKFNSNITFEAFGNYNSQNITLQGKTPAFLMYQFALRKKFLHEKGSIALTTNNPFSKYLDQTIQISGTNFSSVNTRLILVRSVGINFTYRFGRMEFKNKPGSDDQNVLNPGGMGN